MNTHIPRHGKECDGLPVGRFNHRVLKDGLSTSIHNLCCCEIIPRRNVTSLCRRGYTHGSVAISKVTQDLGS